MRKADVTPSVTVIIPAHDEEDVIGARLDNLLALDYPRRAARDRRRLGRLDRRHRRDRQEHAARDPRVRLLALPRGGKLAALNRAVGESTRDVVAFSDANSSWAPDALRKLVRNLADEDVAYVCGKLRLERADGTNREGIYWRYELWLRESESRARLDHGRQRRDLRGSAHRLRRRTASARTSACRTRWSSAASARSTSPRRSRRRSRASNLEDEYRRKVRMFPWAWQHMFEGRMLAGVGPLYLFELISHRVLRYASGLLHVVLLATSIALASHGLVYQVALALQLLWLVLAALGRLRVRVPGAGLAYYYFLVTWATIAALVSYLRFGVSPHWERAEGVR